MRRTRPVFVCSVTGGITDLECDTLEKTPNFARAGFQHMIKLPLSDSPIMIKAAAPFEMRTYTRYATPQAKTSHVFCTTALRGSSREHLFCMREALLGPVYSFKRPGSHMFDLENVEEAQILLDFFLHSILAARACA